MRKAATGRDHNHKAFSMWMQEGACCRDTLAEAATSESKATENPVSHRRFPCDYSWPFSGLDHEKLTYPYAGRDFRLT